MKSRQHRHRAQHLRREHHIARQRCARARFVGRHAFCEQTPRRLLIERCCRGRRRFDAGVERPAGVGADERPRAAGTARDLDADVRALGRGGVAEGVRDAARLRIDVDEPAAVPIASARHDAEIVSDHVRGAVLHRPRSADRGRGPLVVRQRREEIDKLRVHLRKKIDDSRWALQAAWRIVASFGFTTEARRARRVEL